MFRKVLVAIMGAATEDPALAVAEDLATAMGAEVVLAGIIPITGGPLQVTDAMEAERRDAARAFLDRALTRMRDHGVAPSAVELTGPPADAILDYARQQGVDLIVLPTGGHPPTAPVLEDLAMRVMQRARCPVLTVPRAVM